MADENEGNEGNESNENGRPEGLADKFWDEGTKTVRVSDLSKSYNDLTASYTRKTEDIVKDLDTERLGSRPESADMYEFKMPDSVEVPPGFQMNLIDDHPLVGFWRDQAWNAGLDQAGFEAGVAQYLGAEISKLPVLADEHTKLGENGSDRFTRVQDYMKTFTTEEEFAKLGGLITTADGIQIVEKMMDKQATPFQKSAGDTTVVAEDNPANLDTFDAKTKRLMGEEAYRSGDAGALAAVRERWSKAYPDSIEPERNSPRRR